MRPGAAALCVLFALGGCAHRAVREGKAPPPPPQAAGKPASAVAPGPNAGRYSQEHDSAPDAIPDLSKIPEPVPKAEPPSRIGNKSPYTVLGHSYQVMDRCAGYLEKGIASWYGNKFHGHLTSNRESYDMYAYSAAHKTLPLPCYARVTNLENGRSVVVRINDRGPFFENRIIDLSYVAAIKLGINGRGTGLVEVRSFDPGAHESAAAAGTRAPAPVARKSTLQLQAGAFADAENAKKMQQRLAGAGIKAVHVERVERAGRVLNAVRIGPLAGVDELDRISAQLKDLGIDSVSVQID